MKIGWNGDELVIEVHETLEVTLPETVVSEDVSGEEQPAVVEPPIVRDAMTALTEQFVAATNERSGQLDWDTAEELLARADGIPAVAGRRIKDAATSAASE